VTAAGFDPIGILRVLTRTQVDFVVIGGFAAELRGAPLITNDLDICHDRSPDNLERLAGALHQLGAKLRVAKVEEELPFILDARTLAAGDCFTLVTNLGSLDVLGTPSGTKGFQDLVTASTSVPVAEDLAILVGALPDLMRMKRASPRIKDKMHLEVLAALQEEIEQAEQNAPT
jgi:hypothetical protein